MQAHAEQLSRRLAAEGWELEVATYQPGDREEATATADLDLTFPFPVRRCLSRLGHHENLARLEALGKRFRPDLVYASTVFYGALGARLGVPILARSVGNDVLRPWIVWPFRLGSRFVAQPWLEGRLFRWFRSLRRPERLEALLRARRVSLMAGSARQHTGILANSTFTAGLLERVGLPPERLQVLVGGVDAAAFAPPEALDREALRRELGLPAQGPLFLTACRMVPKKGLDVLLTALARIRPEAHLVVVGDGAHRPRAEALARDLGLASRTHFPGRVSHGDMPRWFHAADAFVLASREHVHPRTGLRDVETMGRVLCEANAAGLPVAATVSGGIPDVIRHGHNGLLVPEGDVPALAQAMEALLDPALATHLRLAGLAEARNRFDWSVILDQHRAAFHLARRGMMTAP